MSSQRRIDASRANGARSQGPVTAAGKERSSQNAVRHGLVARAVVLADENPEAFEALLTAFTEKFQPADLVELSLVEQMAAALWRQQRSCAIESAIMDARAADSKASRGVPRIAEAFTALAAGPELPLMHRYETRHSRIYYRALQNLLTLRKMTVQNEPSPISEHPGVRPDPLPTPALDAEPTGPEPSDSLPDPLPTSPSAASDPQSPLSDNPGPNPAPCPLPPPEPVIPVEAAAPPPRRCLDDFDFYEAHRRLRALGIEP